MAYDEKCRELAQYFLADEPGAKSADADALAQFIQNAVEDWLNHSLPERREARGERP